MEIVDTRLNDKDRRQLTKKKELAERWKRYFKVITKCQGE